MHEVSVTDPVEEDPVSQDPLKDHLAVRAAIDGSGAKHGGRRKRVAAAVGLALLIVLLGAVLVVASARR